MGDHMVLCVDHLVKPESLHSLQGDEVSGSSGEGSCSHTIDSSTSIDIKDVVEHGGDDEQEPLIQAVECRICQEEDSIQNMEFPCACSGSLKFAHRKCVQRWCNEKGDITCEICHQMVKVEAATPGNAAAEAVARTKSTRKEEEVRKRDMIVRMREDKPTLAQILNEIDEREREREREEEEEDEDDNEEEEEEEEEEDDGEEMLKKRRLSDRRGDRER
ncbi:hypothetical protein TEA_026599 [Camellia sinensis var. sinensis]|uniref:RING-CH-type domain-containing protein n=1 Tax=Camellia sinensis var. sinensis TaxID=542762 RepID=A0A4S4D8L4_CAMSN|nr:hypothetical protein TEA_026599 [Camellia sinensis var. sinensis]